MNKAQFIEFSRAFLLNYCTSAVAEGLEKGDAFDHRVISDELQVEASEIDGDENGNLVIVDVVRDVTLNADIDNIFSMPLLLLLDEVAPEITAIHLIMLHSRLQGTIDLNEVHDFLWEKRYFLKEEHL